MELNEKIVSCCKELKLPTTIEQYHTLSPTSKLNTNINLLTLR